MKNFNKGFTLIELLVVISIIGLLSSIVFASLNSARENARITKAKAELNSIRSAMYLYLDSYDELPPIGDSCSSCTNPCNQGSWNAVGTAMINAGVMSVAPSQDPWGQAYCYDDNYGQSNCATAHTYLWSSGPNGSNESRAGDDIWIRVSEPAC